MSRKSGSKKRRRKVKKQVSRHYKVRVSSPVIVYDYTTGEALMIFRSVKDASDGTGASMGNISAFCLRGTQHGARHLRGYTFRHLVTVNCERVLAGLDYYEIE